VDSWCAGNRLSRQRRAGRPVRQADHIDIHISPLNESLLTISGLTQVTNVRVIPPG
jgi:hypothetical protein